MPTGRIDQAICFSYKNQQTGLNLINRSNINLIKFDIFCQIF